MINMKKTKYKNKMYVRAVFDKIHSAGQKNFQDIVSNIFIMNRQQRMDGGFLFRSHRHLETKY